MLNIENYYNNKNIINIKSEVLFREAEDDFFYFNKINTAQKKLEEAIKLTPTHTKSLMLCGDICFIKGNIKKALNLYSQAFNYASDKTRCLCAMANCNMLLNKFEIAISFVDKAISSFEFKEQNLDLYSQAVEIKINSLLALKQYKNAYMTFIQAQNTVNSVSLKNIFNDNFETINKKLQIQKRIQQSDLKIV